MKRFKKMMALVIATMMIAMYAVVPTWAASDYQITVENTNTSMSINGKQYKAYKVFDLTLGGASDTYTVASEYDASATYYTRTGTDPDFTYTEATVADEDAFAAGTYYVKGDQKYSAYAYSIKNNSWAWATLVAGATTATNGVITTTYGIKLTPSAADPTTYVVDGESMTEENARNLADALESELDNATVAGTGTGENEKAVIPLSEGGYYAVYGVVKPTDPKASEEVVAAVGLTTTDKKVTVNPKASVPTLDKKITGVTETDGTAVNDAVLDAAGQAAVAKVGSKVSFQIDSKVPDLRGYETYIFKITDTLTAGLDYDDASLSSLVVKINGTTVPASTQTEGEAGATVTTPNYTLTVNGRSFELTIPKATLSKYDADDPIVVTYDAILNNSALTTDYEKNTAKLTYSNTPYPDGSGTPTNDTPDKETYVIDLNLDVDKVAAGATSTKLDGAQFKLYKSVPGTATYTVASEYDASATYYSDNDGTDTVVTVADADAFAAAGTLYTKSEGEASKLYYKWDTTNNKVTWVNTQAAGDTFTTEADGSLDQQVRGLDKGTYYFEETKAPEGYNLLAAPVEVVISVTETVPTPATDTTPATTEHKVTYTATYGGENATMTNGAVDLTTATQAAKQPVAIGVIQNASGSELPSTGGIGTTLFYLIGAILVIGAGVVLVTRRRVNSEE